MTSTIPAATNGSERADKVRDLASGRAGNYRAKRSKMSVTTAERGRFHMIVKGSRGLGDSKCLLVGSVLPEFSHPARSTCACDN